MRRLLTCVTILLLIKFSAAQNVGIGTITPGAKLHVFNGSSGYNSSYFPGVVIEGSGNTYLNFLTPNNSESSVLFGRASDAASGGIVYNNSGTTNGLQFRTNGNLTRMVIDQSGYIGIGVLTPAYPLNFASSLGDKISLYGTGTNHYGFGIQGSLLQIHSATSFDDIAFGYGSSSSFTETMRIKGNGNVGIGNNNPNYLLDVSQRMRIRSGGNNSVSAGLWLNNNSNTEAAFVGMEDDTHVGLFGNNGAGWKFSMNTQTGALKMNGSEGNAGQILQSNGSGSATTWINPLNSLFNSMSSYSQTSFIDNGTAVSAVDIPGLANIPFTITSTSKIIGSVQGSLYSLSCSFCNYSWGYISARIYSTSDPINWIDEFGGEGAPPNGARINVENGMTLITLSPGNYYFRVVYVHEAGPTVRVDVTKLNFIIVRQ